MNLSYYSLELLLNEKIYIIVGLPGFEAEPKDLNVYPGEAAFFSCAVRGPFSLGLPMRPRMQIPEAKPLNLKVCVCIFVCFD